MSDWQETSLADLADYINGRAIKPEECSANQGIPVIRIKQINDPQSIEDRFCGEDLDEKNIARQGDLLFSWSASLKTILWQGETGAINQHIFKVLPKHGINKTFLHYLIDHSIPALSEESHGSTMKHIKKSALSAFRLQIPPLPEQKKIAEILSGIDETIRCHLERLRVLDNIQSSLYCEIPGRADTADGIILGDIVSSINSGWSPVCPPQPRAGDELAILKTTAITWQGYAPDENKVLPSEYNSKDDAIVRSGDILCTRKGPRERVGVVCYVNDTPPNLMVPDTAFRMRLTENMNSHYVSLVLGSKEVQEDWNRKKVGLAEAQVNINHGILKETYIPLPSSERQEALVNAITCSQERIDKEKEKINALQTLRSAVSLDLLSGRKRVSI